MDKNTFTRLLEKYLQGGASEEEKKLLEAYYDQLVHQEPVLLDEADSDILKEKMLSAILSAVQPAPVHSIGRANKMTFLKRIASVAAILIFVAGGVFMMRSGREQ